MKNKIENKKKIQFKKRNFEIGLEQKKISIEELANFCKRKGFVYPSGDLYGGFAGFWDYGHLGSELKKNLKDFWWKFHVYERQDIVGIDGSIITNPKVWEASGHVGSFVDVAVQNKKTKEKKKIDKHEVKDLGSEWEVKGEFNPMFTTFVGPIKEDSTLTYLRPETAQSIFANFKAVQNNARMKLPFGIAQIGKVYRNEIAPRNFLFRCREFEQMEIEYFIDPLKKNDCPGKEEVGNFELNVLSAEMQKKKEDSKKMTVKEALKNKIILLPWHAYWLATELKWFFSLGANPKNFRVRQHEKEEKSHYATDTWDLEYKFPFGWGELQGIADRGTYDLEQHEKYSKKDLKIMDESIGKKVLPMVISEPSLGVERAFLVFMFDAYTKNKKGEIVLRLSPKLAPIKIAIFPIVKKLEFEKISQDVFNELKKEWNVIQDKSGSIGRRYARNDEVGTPYCITIDGDSIKNKDVTIRDRDTTKQIRIKISELKNVFRSLIDEGIYFENIN
jgi:glycyl-tRNA synthetase